MLLDEAETSQFLQWPYAESPWDGDLRDALGKWGYSQEEYADKDCDFKEKYHFGTALEALGIDSKPADQGGSNHCFYLQHNDGPSLNVTDTRLQATGAFARFGVNAKDGIIYFIHRRSPESTDSRRSKDELPKILSSSDLAWGMWNRAAIPTYDIMNIKYFVAVNIINLDTAYSIIPKALRLRGEYDGAKPWPGTSFQPFKREGPNKEEEEAALALIGKLSLLCR
ncbi:hypothetical protein BDU57DRAFT_443135 [Ampelomyces quisqualis]|uniref:Uncharacterized protein n=1 Tax=Ampelomyces quisqualis TaxID=50730 RepID=A0A6A5QTR4_AMPQU|nr:hypothetical protein BDU57DRAFT_443135 [Ampelomyces quisqualis]